jgi:hypothetical protein
MARPKNVTTEAVVDSTAQQAEPVYTGTALATAITPNGVLYVVEIPFNIQTNEVGEMVKTMKPDRDSMVEAFKILAVNKGLV